MQVIDNELNIELRDGQRVYGRMREVEYGPIVVMAHGITCNIFEHPYEYVTRALNAEGFSVYRFGFYAYPPRARSTTDVSFTNHIDDLDDVVRYFVNQGNKVSVIGHSLGGLAALASREQAFDALVTWDASHPDVIRPSNWPDLWVWEPALECWRFENGIVSLIDPRLIGEASALDVRVALADFKRPVKFIAAGGAVCADPAREYHEMALDPKALHIIDAADHGFSGDKHARELVAETIGWLRQHGMQRGQAD